MKTKSIIGRPILIVSQDTNIGFKIFKEFDGTLTYSGFPSNCSSEQKELVIISVDNNEKILVHDDIIRINPNGNTTGYIFKASNVEVSTQSHKGFAKVLARQSIIHQSYIQQFIEQYNKAEVKDIEIDMEYKYQYECDCFKVDITDGCDNPKHNIIIQIPKLINGFISIKEIKSEELSMEEVKDLFLYGTNKSKTIDIRNNDNAELDYAISQMFNFLQKSPFDYKRVERVFWDRIKSLANYK